MRPARTTRKTDTLPQGEGMSGILNDYYRRKITALPQNSCLLSRSALSGTRILDTPAGGSGPTADCRLAPAERRLAILVDKRGWAYHEKAEEKARYIRDEWQTELFFLEDKPVIDSSKFDLLYNFNHTPSHYDKLFHDRLIKGLYSHYHHSSLIPWRYVYNMVKHTAVLVVANSEQAEELKPYFKNTWVLPDGVDTDLFFFEKERTADDIVAGWAGNPDRRLNGRRVKRFYEVVEPACLEAGVELKIAVNLGRDELRRMYNNVDVVLIASVTEGNPLSLLEAGACGRTVIATRVGIVPEIIEDGVNGFIIDSNLSDLQTRDLLTFRLRWCQEHITEVREMGHRLREKILLTRTPEVTGEAFKSLLNHLIFR